MPGTILGPGDTAANMTDKVPTLRNSQLEREMIREKDGVVSAEVWVAQQAVGALRGLLTFGRR